MPRTRTSSYALATSKAALVEWTTPEELTKLRAILQQDGRGIPNNLVIDTAIRYTIDDRYPLSHMRYFSTEVKDDATPTYVFVFEESSKATSGFYVRPPHLGHDDVLLQEALAELIGKYKELFEKEGEMQMLSDAFTRHVLHNLLLSFFPAYEDISPPATLEVFYMSDEQMTMLKEMDLPVVDGFYADSIDADKDAARIDKYWIHSPSLESTTARLRYLPAAVVRESSTREAVSWDMSSPFGQCSNLFTIPSYRGKGLAALAQTHVMKNFVNQGLRPFKYIDVTNWDLLASTRKNPLWTRWEEDYDKTKPVKRDPYFPMLITTLKKKN